MDSFIELFAWGDSGWGDELLRGLGVTLRLAAFSYALGMVLGLAGAGAKLSRARALTWLTESYTTVFRAAPELVILSIIFFGGSILLQRLLGSFGITGYIEIDAFTSGVVAIGLVQGAYATELFRGAILAVPRGQSEAALASGLNRVQVFSLVVLPQAWRIALPGLGNLWMTVLKQTALVSVIGLNDFIRSAQLGAASTWRAFPFYAAVAAGYLLVTAFSMISIARVEEYVNRGQEMKA